MTASDRPTIVLVRPWADEDVETTCCGGRVRDSVCLGDAAGHGSEETHAQDRVAQVYRRIRSALPEADVQIVSSTNSAYLVPWSFRAARRRGSGAWSSLRQAVGSTRGGTVLVDGVVVGDIESDDAERLMANVRMTCA